MSINMVFGPTSPDTNRSPPPALVNAPHSDSRPVFLYLWQTDRVLRMMEENKLGARPEEVIPNLSGPNLLAMVDAVFFPTPANSIPAHLYPQLCSRLQNWVTEGGCVRDTAELRRVGDEDLAYPDPLDEQQHYEQSAATGGQQYRGQQHSAGYNLHQLPAANTSQRPLPLQEQRPAAYPYGFNAPAATQSTARTQNQLPLGSQAQQASALQQQGASAHPPGSSGQAAQQYNSSGSHQQSAGMTSHPAQQPQQQGAASYSYVNGGRSIQQYSAASQQQHAPGVAQQALTIQGNASSPQESQQSHHQQYSAVPSSQGIDSFAQGPSASTTRHTAATFLPTNDHHAASGVPLPNQWEPFYQQALSAPQQSYQLNPDALASTMGTLQLGTGMTSLHPGSAASVHPALSSMQQGSSPNGAVPQQGELFSTSTASTPLHQAYPHMSHTSHYQQQPSSFTPTNSRNQGHSQNDNGIYTQQSFQAFAPTPQTPDSTTAVGQTGSSLRPGPASAVDGQVTPTPGSASTGRPPRWRRLGSASASQAAAPQYNGSPVSLFTPGSAGPPATSRSQQYYAASPSPHTAPQHNAYIPTTPMPRGAGSSAPAVDYRPAGHQAAPQVPTHVIEATQHMQDIDAELARLGVTN